MSGPRVKPERTARGLATFAPIVDRTGAEVTFVESSEQIEPCVWFTITEQPSFDHPGGREASAHVPLDRLRRLRDQIEWMLVNHRQVR